MNGNHTLKTYEKEKMKELFKRIKIAGKLDKATNDQCLHYITEEVGEVATCLAVEAGLKNRVLKESKESELCDVIISSLGLLLRDEEWDYDKVVNQMSKKLERWENRLNIKVK